MTNKAKEVVSEYIQSIVNDAKPQFENILLNGVTSDLTKDEIYVKMIFNSISLSVNLATQIVFDVLDNANVLPIISDEKQLQKLSLRLHTDNVEKE